jgi:hypothetical protein
VRFYLVGKIALAVANKILLRLPISPFLFKLSLCGSAVHRDEIEFADKSKKNWKRRKNDNNIQYKVE